MDFTRFRLWQWMLIGLLAGTAVGFAWTMRPTPLLRTGDEGIFQRGVLSAARLEKLSQPALIRNVVVLEPETDYDNVLIYPVTFDQMERQNFRNFRRPPAAGAAAAPATPPEPTYIKSSIYAKTPYEGSPNIKEFLRKNDVPFTDRTGARHYMPMFMGAAGGLVGIGLVWPAMIVGLIKLGYAKAPPPRERRVKSTARTGADVDDMLVKPTDKTVKAGDVARLDELNEQMEKALAANASAGGTRAASPVAAEHVSTLMSGTGSRNATDPTAAPAPMTEQEKKDYAGQYYPVARPVAHKDDEHKPH